MTRERKTRPEPERPGYDRGYDTSFRSADSWDWPGGDRDAGRPGDAAGSGPGGWADAISDGVRMGYRVIEEQIRQGQRVAEQINDRFYRAGPAGFDGQDITQRMWRSYWDLAAMWWDFVGSMAGGQGFRPQSGWGNGDYPSHDEPVELAIEVESERATRVGLVLSGLRASCRSLVALKLHDAVGNRLEGEIEFDPIVEGEAVRVTVRVSEEQKAGTFTGKVVDGTSGEHLGTLTVHVEA